ncbi:MAG: hypothetical protein E6370_06245 [Clostridiales bacterium]|jgi:hypothetical protein|nr:hypothetical protein [Clostridiales bacterium]MDU6973920.1 hypothetical protein [Clostridiales bacterium]
MKPSNFHFKIGSHDITGAWAIILAILIAIPVIALVGVLLSVVFSIIGIAITFALGVAGITIIISLITLLIPKKWRNKLGIHININRSPKKNSKPTTTPDGKPIIDVDFEETKNS